MSKSPSVDYKAAYVFVGDFCKNKNARLTGDVLR